MRNTSHSSTAADLFQARQQLSSYQQQVEELSAELKKQQESSRGQLENIEQLQNKLKETEMVSGIMVFTDRICSNIFRFCVYNYWCVCFFFCSRGKKQKNFSRKI